MENKPPQLDRSLSLLQATSVNMIDMVGIGPFIVLPLVIKIMGGPQFIFAWIAGALLSIIDGMIWSELGAAYPKAGGSYNFLKEAFGKKWGRLLSFLFVWQTLLLAPLVAASGAIGFSQYCTYIYPFSAIQQKIISGGLIILLVFLLYRKINTIGKISTVLWIAVMITLCWIIYGGITHHTISNKWLPDANSFSAQLFFVALGQATVKTIYSYLGYYNVCHLGGEIRNPEKNIPRSIFISVIGISILYLAMNISVVSVVPWREAQNSSFIVSTFIEKIYGNTAATIATVLVLIVAFASLFAVLLGYSRIPYAAAADGRFFPVFAKLHPTKHFPYVSLLFLGSLAFVFSLLFKLSLVINAILAMRILVQFIGQAIGVVFLRKRNGTKNLPFKMILYPLPVIIAIIIWLFIFMSTGKEMALYATGIIAAGVVVYYLLNRFNKFENPQTKNLSNP
ncbi:APC family permease [Flavobacterium sp.]|uniref:APC family permease n=1 Tax=Flavobacterium sp. TaxID=239 RepID=UPI00374CC249